MAHSENVQVITLAQLGDHNSQEDLWIAVHGKVYDLTRFATDHPGGIDVLKDCAGTDGTETYDYAGHSPNNMKTMQRFLVGALAEHTGNVKPVEDAPANGTAKTPSGSKAASAPMPTLRTGTGIARPLFYAATSILAGLCGAFVWQMVDIRSGDIALELGQIVDAVYTFWGGLFTACSLSCVGMGFLYSQFSQTLKSERDVFSYPPIIPRRVRL